MRDRDYLLQWSISAGERLRDAAALTGSSSSASGLERHSVLKEKRPERTKKEPNKILKKAAAAEVASVVDRKAVVPGVPPTEVRVKTGFNCVIVVEIAGMKFRVVLDTGAARDVIRTSFAEQLRRNAKTKKACYGPRPMSETVSFVGVVDGMRTSEVTHSTQITTDFVDLETNRKAPHELCFAELAEASDALLIGFPSLCLLGFSTDMDDDGNIWITLSKLGVTTLAETPVEDDRIARCA